MIQTHNRCSISPRRRAGRQGARRADPDPQRGVEHLRGAVIAEVDPVGAGAGVELHVGGALDPATRSAHGRGLELTGGRGLPGREHTESSTCAGPSLRKCIPSEQVRGSSFMSAARSPLGDPSRTV